MCANINTTTTIIKHVVYKMQEKWLDISKYCEWNKLFFIKQEKSLCIAGISFHHRRSYEDYTLFSGNSDTSAFSMHKHFRQIDTIFIAVKKTVNVVLRKQTNKKKYFFLQFLKLFKYLL